MSNALLKNIPEITNDPFAFHKPEKADARFEHKHSITPMGASILDDVETHLGEMGPMAEKYFSEALSVLACAILMD